MRARLVLLLSIATTGAAQTATISGIVTDALTHLPLQGAAITADGAIIRTDIEGRYSLAVAPSATVHLAASRTGYFAVAKPATVLTGETLQRNFELHPLLKISGVVEDYDTGDPIPGCHVFAMQRIYALGRAWHVPAGLITADTRDGRFEIHNLEPGDYVLEIVPENAAPIATPEAKPEPPSKKFHGWSYYPDASRIEIAAPITVTESGDVPVTIRLRKREPRAISGTVTAPSSIELVRYVGDQARTVASRDLSAAGPFRIGGLPEGEYLLTARATDGALAALPVTIGDRDLTDLRLAPSAVPMAMGSIRTEDGTPLPPVTLWITGPPMNRTIHRDMQVWIREGQFEIPDGGGEYKLSFLGLPEGYAAVPGPRLDYTIARTGSLKGNVKDGEYILLPGGITLTGEFTIDLAPGKYQIARLEGAETKLIRDKEFLQAKAAAAAATTIEIKSGETTMFKP